MISSVGQASNPLLGYYLFSSTTNSLSQLESQANGALSRGIDLYQKGDYSGAVVQFNQSMVYSPGSENAPKTFKFLALAYDKQGKTEEAIKVYKQAIAANPLDDTFRLSLGDLYKRNERENEALVEYAKAVELKPLSSDNRYALGQSYLSLGRLVEAQDQFTKVTQLAPNNPAGYFGLGQVFRKSERYDQAINNLNTAVSKDPTFANALMELGLTYTDMGEFDQAQNQLEPLTRLSADSQMAILNNYLNTETSPKISVGFNLDGFKAYAGPGTHVSDLDSTLSAAGVTKEFNMIFLFSKDMDLNSVQSLANWEISRQFGGHFSDDYNYGLAIPSTEVSFSTQPINVAYNPTDRTAWVTFQVTQNQTADGTIDPSHILFKFKGVDSYGKAMDPKADEFSGFSMTV
jgi:tetratricopeptide (TPR) repeat protein